MSELKVNVASCLMTFCPCVSVSVCVCMRAVGV